MALDFNTVPYNDDYDEDKKFYKILFRPGYPVQARELTQMQTILQKQVERHGSALFKQGAMVIPGQMSIYTKVDYIKLQSSYSGTAVDSYINQFAGQTITGTSGLTATVFYVSPATQTDPHILYIFYTNSSSTTKTFATSEVITSGNGYSAAVATTAATGQGSFAAIQRGVYFINGQFVLVEAQTIPLDKFGITPSYRVGLNISEKIVTPELDATLLDNAQGAYNYAAPGAHRHYIELILDKRSLSSTDDTNFVSLSVVNNGLITRDTRITEYSELEKTLARRTNDEAGSYTVTNFGLDVREYRNNDRGVWTTATPYLAGDIVTVSGNAYTAITSGVSNIAPSSTSEGAIDTDGSLTWERTSRPLYNRGVYVATGATLTDHQNQEALLAVGLEPGKAYVEGYEIEKIAVEFLPVPKARAVSPNKITNHAIPANVGNYVIVTAASSIPTTFAKVTLYDRFAGTPGTAPAGGNVVGTAYVHALEYNTGTTQKLFLFGVSMNTGKDFARNVKSFYISGDGFTANINPIYASEIGSISVSTTAVTGVGTSFLTNLQANDYIYVPGTNQTLQVASVGSQTTATLVASATSLTGQAYQLVTTEIVDPLNVDAIYKLPYYAVASVANVTYQTYEKFTNVSSDASGNATFTYTGSGTLVPYTIINYLVAANNAIVTPTTANVVGNQISFTGLPVSTTISCVGTAQYVGTLGTTEKVKTLTTQTTTFTTAAAGGTIITLDKADGYKLCRVEMDTSVAFGGAPTWATVTDITDRYDFYNGQTESFYGPAYLKLKDSYVPASNPIRVVYQYFAHGTGQYFSLNSYSGAISYNKIPSYLTYELRDSFDFRPRSDDGVTLAGTGAVKNGTNMYLDMTYYQGRSDVVSLQTNGGFVTTFGQSADMPIGPKEPPNTMTLYGMSLQPYTFDTTPQNIQVIATDNRRYTMRDIGALEKRIEQLEYYTSLNMLEQETKSTSLPDDQGNERFKNGFVVDSFKGSGIGDTTSVDWVCATDNVAGELRPYFSQQSIQMIEQNSTDAARLNNKYHVWTSGIMTMSLNQTTPEIALINQSYGTHIENLNPFSVFSYDGAMTMTPATDSWFEHTKNPHIIFNDDKQHSQPRGHRATQGVFGTHWLGWKRHWHGEHHWHSPAMGPQVPTGRPTNINKTDKHNYHNEVDQKNRRRFTDDDTIHQGYHHQNDGRDWDWREHEIAANSKGNARDKIYPVKAPGTNTTDKEDRTVSTDIIPYIRSRPVAIQVTKLKPNTRFYPFFDGVRVDDFCTPATILEINPTNTKSFDDSTPVGSKVVDPARKHHKNHAHAYHRGDKITTQNGTTAVVGHHTNYHGHHHLHVHNTKKDRAEAGYVVGHTLSGDITDATLAVAQGTILSISTPTTLVSDEQGNLNFTFEIPNTEAMRFRTGTREFKIIDAEIDSPTTVTSRAHSYYVAEGIVETEDSTTVICVRGHHHYRRPPPNKTSNTNTVLTTSDPVVVPPSTLADPAPIPDAAPPSVTSGSSPATMSPSNPSPVSIPFTTGAAGATNYTATNTNSGVSYSDGTNTIPAAGNTDHVNPLAQSFLIQNKGGVMLTKIDVFFATKDATMPITMEIREMVNGYPGPTVVPFSRVTVLSDDVQISGLTVTLPDGTQVAKWDTPTSFVFSAPLYLKDATEYAMVLMADSQNYNVWIAQMGETMPGSTRTVSKQPNMGSLFKSQNASTWTAAQDQDLMFTIWQANFDIGTTTAPTQTLCRFVNADLPYITLETNPFEVRSGSNKVRVHMKDHGLVDNSVFTIAPVLTSASGTITTSTSSTAFTSSANLATQGIAVGTTLYTMDDPEVLIGTVASVSGTSGTLTANAAVALSAGPYQYQNQIIPGIANTDIFKQQTSITGVDADWFVITATGFSTVTGYYGGDGVRCEQSVQYDVLFPSAQVLNFPETTIAYGLTGISGKSLNSSQTPFSIDTIVSPITINEDNHLASRKMLANRASEVSLLSNDYSAKFDIQMTSTNASLSPMIDIERMNFVGIKNRINQPYETNTNIGGLDDQTVVTSSLIAFSAAASSITSADAPTQALLLAIPLGRVIAVSGSTTGSNNSVWVVTGYLSNGITVAASTGNSASLVDQSTGTSITLTQRVTFLSEIAVRGSSALSKFVSNRINLDNPSTYLRVTVSAMVPVNSNIEMYYRTCPVGGTVNLNLQPWVLMNPDRAIVNSSSTFSDVNYSLENMTSYDGLMIKIVFKGTDAANVPVIKDLRIICCA